MACDYVSHVYMPNAPRANVTRIEAVAIPKLNDCFFFSVPEIPPCEPTQSTRDLTSDARQSGPGPEGSPVPQPGIPTRFCLHDVNTPYVMSASTGNAAVANKSAQRPL